MMTVPLLYLYLLLVIKCNPKRLYVDCKEFHSLSEYIVTFVKVFIYSYDILKILLDTIFNQGDI